MTTIKKAAVIGAGVMGSGIAAHLANAGLDVVLLDIEKKFADAGVARQLKAGGFMDPAFSEKIRTGSTKDDLGLIADADWIVEAVAEKLEVKQTLYRSVDGVRKKGSIVSSNTSTIPLHSLVDGLPNGFAADFLITHFFNPPRIMRLLELVSGKATKLEVTVAIRDFVDHVLGKSVVQAKDTPGFIANRIGNYWIAVAQNEAIALGLNVEEADAVIGKPFGIPATGIFGLLDLVGIDLLPTILRSLQNATPAGDAIHDYDAEPPLIARMIAENRIGRKSGAGFVRLSPDRKSRDITDLATGEYRPQKAVSSDSLEASRGDPRALMEHPAPGGRYASVVMEKVLAYAAALVPEIADTPDAVDEAMRTGYGWKQGPFELIDLFGAGWLKARLEARGVAVPAFLALAAEKSGFYSVVNGRRSNLLPDGGIEPIAQSDGVLLLADLRLAGKPVEDWGAASLWDIGDGVACLEFRTKMNTFNPDLLDAIGKAVERTAKDFRALVIGSDSAVFSAGADLRVFLDIVEKGGREALGAFLDYHGHSTFKALKYAPFPVVGAAAGLALGGGCEILLHCDAIQAHAELSIGLVETRIGVIPGWGGCKEMLLRFSERTAALRGPVAPAIAAFNLIASAKVSSSAFDARKLGFLRSSDGITMNRSRLIADAKAKALALAANYAPPEPRLIALSGPSGTSAIGNILDSEALAGRATVHDGVVGRALANVLTGGPSADPLKPLTEDDVTALEREAFVDLLVTPGTLDRVKHMLATGEPLRN
ncbi:3-hydroxyacyl-CoA dehydrogenase/enoyl-CoA hydratase family protein [Mesorhizobium sp. DCY119]|uniref:3-hydroxyacyl-CoA dehydrogenase/enoyl-CoA hydratase family protein n=1 Tax=Mesorhizobium sp. DCY119 TaxID=2108445 RepID=UPI000E7380D9|nr:3-hydroxyacyl-CoA dehydrogenase/enoyl-CoA hydratase family protein [Mesorhizobium sp. DCY119]RJG39872.1 3-hydroxyacyl-CoA dehydrogenase/enoyl-CoA hydratase family protein [Mesorhizobium sp. DCY119]